MKFSTSVLLAVLGSVQSISAWCSQDNGNYYCSAVDAVVYSGIGYSGSYKDVTNMDESSCECTQETTTFSGSMSPLDEELSVHFRGPLKLLQFGVYYPSSSDKKKRDEECSTTKHVHHQHKRAPAVEYVHVTATVMVDQNGNLVTQTAASTETAAAGDASASSATTQSVVQSLTTSVSSSSSSSSTSESSTSAEDSSSSSSSSTDSSSEEASSTSSSSAATGTSSTGSGWQRSSYYTPGSTDNTVFMNYLGGKTSSGTWSKCFGNSLSFCGSDGTSASSSAVALDETTLASGEEYIIFSGEECSGDECGYYRSGIPAYKGFKGQNKMFVFEFEMPSADSSESSVYNYDMPAVWLLNAKIPRTLQYGDASCSCWSTGCGELDLFEILSSGSDKLISHLHSGQGNDGSSRGGGGSQDYFERPTSGSMKAAVIFNDGEVHLVKLDDTEDFGSSLDSDTVSEWLQKTGGVAQI